MNGQDRLYITPTCGKTAARSTSPSRLIPRPAGLASGRRTVINDAGMIGGSGPRDIQWRGFVLIPNAAVGRRVRQTHQSAIAANIVVRFTHLTKSRPVSLSTGKHPSPAGA